MKKLNGLGDSNTTGGTSYVNGLAAALGMDLNNLGTGSDQAADQSIKSQSLILGADDIGTIMIGTNDHKNYKRDRLKHNHYRSALRRCIGNLLHPDRQSARLASKTGTWGNSASAMGIYSSDAGSKVSFNVAGRYVSIGYLIQNADITVGSVGKVYCNGVYLGSFGSDGYSASMATINGANWCGGLLTFDIGYTGSHVVDVVQSSEGKRLYVDDARGSDQPYSVKVAVGNVLKMSAAAYAQYGTDETNVNVLNGIVQCVVDEFRYMGHDVTLVDVFSAIDPDADLYDGVHLSLETGQPKVQALFEAVLATECV